MVALADARVVALCGLARRRRGRRLRVLERRVDGATALSAATLPPAVGSARRPGSAASLRAGWSVRARAGAGHYQATNQPLLPARNSRDPWPGRCTSPSRLVLTGAAKSL